MTTEMLTVTVLFFLKSGDDGNTLQAPDQWLGPIPEDSVSMKSSINERSSIPPYVRERSMTMVHSIDDLSTDSTIFYKEKMSRAAGSLISLDEMDGSLNNDPSVASKQSGCLATVRRYLDITLVKNPLFLLMASTVMLMAVGNHSFSY